MLGYCFLLIALSSPAAALSITPEQPLADLSPAPPEGQQWLGAIATDGQGFFVFWSGWGGLYATPLTAEGHVAGPRVAISFSPGLREVSACWTGSVYLTTWRNDAENAIYAATVSRKGAVVSEPHVVVRGATTRSGSLASNGRRAFLAYATTEAPSTVRGALFDAAGDIVAIGLPLPIDDISSSLVESVPRVTTDGSEFAAVWRSGELVPIAGTPFRQLFHTFHLLRISDSGAPIADPTTVARVEQTIDFGVTFGGDVYVITALIGRRIQRFVVDFPNGAVATLPPVEAEGWNAGVLWDGRQFIAYWMNYSATSYELFILPFAREQRDAVPIKAVSGPRLARSPLLASNGRTLVAAWSEDMFQTHGAHSAIRGAVLDANRKSASGETDSFLISFGWSRQLIPVIASSRSSSLIVWIESSRPGSGRLVGMRVAPDGRRMDQTPFEIAPDVSTSEGARVTSVGATYLVVWSERTSLPGQMSVVARRVGEDGSLGSRNVLGTGYGIAVASNPVTALIAFTAPQHLVGYRFDARGEPLDATPIIIGQGYVPEVATNGTDFLVAWNVGSDYWQFPSADLIDVFAARVTAAGAVDASPLPIAIGQSNQFIQGVASDGRDYIVFYGLRHSPYSAGVLASKRVLREGQLDGVTARDDGTVAGELITLTSVVHSGGAFWLAGLHETRSVRSIVLLQTDLRGNPGAAIPLASYTSAMPPGFASLAPARGGWLQIVYARRMTEEPYTGASRVFLRMVSNAPPGRRRPAFR